ncbi:NAD-dependent malic enzyme [Paenibacillus sp. P96]|uniref:NAD-dependent malic enzyme n=1 Tax=Paenibacillus zeirhizosphaerae TaxID=2987519 RepID=A0ABT9FVF4_9BACL|nr:NAD-dependent malic enzyme [Paenibacillus sp. P96]MDP4098713.1 NAD-dependent malic enzyme [Paenibacillus sp. P96]
MTVTTFIHPVVVVKNKGRIFETDARGRDLLTHARLNKGTAFTEQERRALGLTGLLPPAVISPQSQSDRVYEQYQRQQGDEAKQVYLTALLNRNETLFYRVVIEHLEEMLPIIYTPTIAKAIQHFSHEFRSPQGIYLSINKPDDIEVSFRNCGFTKEDIDIVVVSDGERILGIGDWGVGGVNIAIGKKTVYSVAAGIPPWRILPVILDVGTNNKTLLEDPLYLGNRHERVTGEAYDSFVERFVAVVEQSYPGVLLHWEDFGGQNARRLLEKYKDRLCTFNDDMQGTGAITLAAVLAGVQASGVPLLEQKIVIFGAGTAGIGIADQIRQAMQRKGMSATEAAARFWCIDRYGLVVQGAEGITDVQKLYARQPDEVESWEGRGSKEGISLVEVIRRIQPTMLIGASTVSGAFTEEAVREMAKGTKTPVIMPLSNPTEKSEAKPADLLNWTDGKALIVTGSPFADVEYKGGTYKIGQANNALVYPGIGLGTIAVKASRVTDSMLTAAAEAVASKITHYKAGESLLPGVHDLRLLSRDVAIAVGQAAIKEDVASKGLMADDVERAVDEAAWQAEYPEIHPLD